MCKCVCMGNCACANLFHRACRLHPSKSTRHTHNLLPSRVQTAAPPPPPPPLYTRLHVIGNSFSTILGLTDCKNDLDLWRLMNRFWRRCRRRRQGRERRGRRQWAFCFIFAASLHTSWVENNFNWLGVVSLFLLFPLPRLLGHSQDWKTLGQKTLGPLNPRASWP